MGIGVPIPNRLNQDSQMLIRWPLPPPALGLEGVGEYKSRPRRADAQWLVTTRLLDHVHDPLAHLGRLQRIHPRVCVK